MAIENEEVKVVVEIMIVFEKIDEVEKELKKLIKLTPWELDKIIEEIEKKMEALK